MCITQRFASLFVVLSIGLLTAAAQLPSEVQPSDTFVFANTLGRLVLTPDGGIQSLTLQNGRELLSETNARLMILQIGGKWYGSNSLSVQRTDHENQLHVGFQGTSIAAQAVLKVHSTYFEVRTVGLTGEGCEDVQRWCFANVPVNIRTNIGNWLNVAWDDDAAAALLTLDEKTQSGGTPNLHASTCQKLGLQPGAAALVVAPKNAMLGIIEQIELEHHLPHPTLGDQWAKTSRETRKAWMITGLTAATEPADFQAERVFQVAESMGVEYIVISLSWWNTSLGSYRLNPTHFPDGVASLKKVVDQAHERGLKLGIHVMTGSISKDDAFVTPQPDRRLLTDGEVKLAAPVDAQAQSLATVESPVQFGTAGGYWAYNGTDVLIDQEIIHYQSLSADAPHSLNQCVRGAYGTTAAAHLAGASVRHLTERYGWYVAGPELAEEIGLRLAQLIDDAGLDMVCFDGADVSADPETVYFAGHQVPLSIYRHVHRDVLLISNGSSHFGWHLMTRGGEEDAMARGFQGWVDHRTVHGWGAFHRQNLLVPDFSWVGIFGHTPTMTAARPDDIELVCARSLGFDAPIGWGLAACYGGPSTVAVFNQNGRHNEMAQLIRTYDQLRMNDYFSADERRPLQELGTHWRLLPPSEGHERYRLTAARDLRSPILELSLPDSSHWTVCNDLVEQPLRARIEALPALSTYGDERNIVVADFGKLTFTPEANEAAGLCFEKTEEVHPQAGTVVRLRCNGPDSKANFPTKLIGNGQKAWAQASASYATPINLSNHRALGMWINGDGQGEVLNVQLQVSPQSYLHYYLPIDFRGWKYVLLGEPEGDRVMDYYTYEKSALHDLPLDRFTGVTLMILAPPAGKPIELQIGRIEALQELGGELVEPRIEVGGRTLRLPITLKPEQYAEIGDPWSSRDDRLCRVFDADGNELSRVTLESQALIPQGQLDLRLSSEGMPTGRARVTLLLEGN